MDDDIANNESSLNSQKNRDLLIKFFPNLATDSQFVIKSPATPEYNCIAFAMGIDGFWVQPYSSNIPWTWWPNCDQGLLPDHLVKAFEALSFERCTDGHYEEGYDKVALYSKDGKWTHAAKVFDNGALFHSKFGPCFDGTHSGEDTLDGENGYGKIFQYMKRLISLRCKSLEALGGKKGVIRVNVPVYLYDKKLFVDLRGRIGSVSF